MASKAFLDWLRENQLGYSFGLMPTIGDARGIHEGLKKGLKARKTRVTATIVGKGTQTFKTDLVPGTGLVSASMVEEFATLRVDGVRATLVKPMYQNEVFSQFITATMGVNGATVLWDCVPFGWVLDWFLSVDSVLDNIWAQSQTEYQLEYWTSTKSQYKRSVRYSTWSGVSGKYPQVVKQISDNGLLASSYSLYKRNPRAQPSPLSGLHERLTLKKVYLMALVALGFVHK